QRRITLNNAMSITPGSPDQQPGDDQNMGQFSVKTSAPSGSDLGDIQHPFPTSNLLTVALVAPQLDLIQVNFGPHGV
ncbi:MAG: hypothetical protein KKG17_14375, partial [Alphaproteobacteria bacterium]|nr:hypothetical protein [Alphaproteobacteria bacterium]MBU1561925.1 hypothetical protein [Alphaproteobacteria bacterium]